MGKISYGCICLDIKNRKTLLIQRRDSAVFLHFLRGFFKPADLEYILAGCTLEEHAYIADLLNCSKSERRTKLMQFLTQRYTYDQSVIHTAKCMKGIDYNYDIIKSLLMSIPAKKYRDWLWPKGGCFKNEDTFTAAIRETYEESGVQIPKGMIDFSRTIDVEVTTFFGMIITNKYYLALIDSEKFIIPNADPIGNREVARVEWVTYEDAMMRLSGEYLSVIRELISKYDNGNVQVRTPIVRTGSDPYDHAVTSTVIDTSIVTPV